MERETHSMIFEMTLKSIWPFLIVLAHQQIVFAQPLSDSNIVHLDNVEIRGYFAPQPISGSTLSAFVIDKKRIGAFENQSLVPVLNTVPGVRMEERSPGSYRLSIRGSLLRSPFGVRDVKVYMEGMPLTDASGNTYLNSISLTALQNIEVLKGPDGSVFGANSGGVVLLNVANESADSSKVSLGLQGGSYQSGMQSIALKQQLGKHDLQFAQSFQTQGGYRENSAMARLYLHALDRWKYKEDRELDFFLLYSKLHYETPGGLTLAQYETNPELARTATGSVPGAIEQKAGIFNDLVFGGIRHKAKIRPHLKNDFSVFGSYADFKNPFITNYESRKESTIGSRLYFTFSGNEINKLPFWEYAIGLEGQVTNSKINNFDNDKGEKGNLQSADEINSYQYFAFSHLKLNFHERFFLEASLSLNFAGYRFLDGLKNDFNPQLMPRLAASIKANDQLSFRALLSRGFSAPTTAEIRPSDNKIYPGLLPEKGWNYEAGFRFSVLNNKLWMDVSAFYYHLQQAIVRRENVDGTEYFINSGGTLQPGAEAYVSYHIFDGSNKQFFSGLSLFSSYTKNWFKFKSYSVNENDYSGNNLTGIPNQVFSAGMTGKFLAFVSYSLFYNYTDKIPLDDANSIYSTPYHLLAAKVSVKVDVLKTSVLIFASADNILNQKYSLGNDLNAFGGRYFNAAPLRNFTVGIQLEK